MDIFFRIIIFFEMCESVDADKIAKLWQKISENGIALPLCSIEEVELFSEKLQRDKELRQSLVRIFVFIYHVIHVDYIMLVNFSLIDGLHSLFLLQIDYFRANLEVAFPKDFQGFVKGAFSGLFSIRFQLRAPPLFGDACPNKHVRSLILTRILIFQAFVMLLII
jgi:hypothetical protein